MADAGADQTVECNSHTGTSVTLDGSASSDPDAGDTLSYEWRDAGNNIIGTSAAATVSVPLGTHTFTLTVSDGNGGSASDSVQVVVQDTTPPTLTLSSTTETIVVPTASSSGVAVDVLAASGAAANDVCDPSPSLSHNGPAVFPLGTTIVTITATDDSGNYSQKTFTVQVVYNFIGFLMPIRNDGSSIFRSGRAVPVKFQLTAADGSFISNATATLQVFQVTDQVLGTVEEVTPDASGSSNTGNLFRYDSTSNQYIYDLSTKGYASGTYLLRAVLNDGTTHEVQVSVR
ncbi:MAG: PKD domain-containing protein [Acidobacteria bacterium]|nr:PKD domain-containing protein [Acidobacteriota bacterium]